MLCTSRFLSILLTCSFFASNSLIAIPQPVSFLDAQGQYEWENTPAECYPYPQYHFDAPDHHSNGSYQNANNYENGHGSNGNGGNGNGNGKNGGNGNSSGRGGNIGNSYKGGAGVLPEGYKTAYFGYSAFKTDHFFDKDGDKRAIGSDVYCQMYTGYFEYGLTQYDTVTANFNYIKIRQTEAIHNDIQGWADFQFGWKRLLWDWDDNIFSFNFILTVPSGSRRDQFVAIRLAEFAELCLFQLSHEFKIGCRPAGLDLNAGYQFYQGRPADAVVLAAGLRCEVVDHFLVIGSLNFYDNVGNGRPIFFPTAPAAALQHAFDEEIIDAEVTNFGILNTRLLVGTVYLCYSFEYVTATVGTARNFWGRNIGAQTTYFGGLTIGF